MIYPTTQRIFFQGMDSLTLESAAGNFLVHLFTYLMSYWDSQPKLGLKLFFLRLFSDLFI